MRFLPLIAALPLTTLLACASTPPPSPTDACLRQGLASGPELVCPLLPGMAVPDVVVSDVKGGSVSVRTLAEKPSVIVFYRGGWCPFCNVQMGQLQAIEGDIRAAGYEIVAVSPDDAAGLAKSTEQHSLSYRLLSDTSLSAAKAFGVAFHVDAGMGLALRAMAPQHDGLPVPAVFVVDKGVVRFSYANPNFKVRLSPELLLAALSAPPSSASSSPASSPASTTAPPEAAPSGE